MARTGRSFPTRSLLVRTNSGLATTPVSATAAFPVETMGGITAAAVEQLDTIAVVPVTASAGVEVLQPVDSNRLTDLVDGSTAGAAAFGTTTVVLQAQSFTAAVDGAVVWAEMFAAKVGAPADGVTVSIATDAAGTNLLATSGTISASALGTVGARTRFTFAAPALVSAGSGYYLVIKRTGAGSDTDYYTAGYRAS